MIKLNKNDFDNQNNSLIKYYNNVKYINIIITIGIAFSTFTFFFIIRNVALTTHDDIHSYILVQLYNFKDVLKYSINNSIHLGRFFQFTNTFVTYIVYAYNSLFIYKLIIYIYISFSVFSLWFLLYKHLDKYIASLSVLLFFTFAEISQIHNGFISFTAQANIGFLFLSLERLLAYYETKKTYLLFISSILLLIPVMLYEMFILFCIMFFIISLLYTYKDNKNYKCILNSLYDLRFHIIFMLIYLVIYIYFRLNTEIRYGGATVELSSIKNSFIALLRYSTGSFPLNTFRRIFRHIDIIKYIDLLSIIKATIAAITLSVIIKKVPYFTNKKTIIYILFSLLGMVSSVLLICITPQHVDWCVNHGIYIFLPSYYSYFFISILLSVILLLIYNKIRFKKLFIILLFSITFCTSIFTDITNKYFSEYFVRNFNKYKILNNMITNDLFLNIENESIIYVPDYIGVHYNLDSFNDLISIYNKEKMFKFVNNINELNFDEKVYMIKYNEDNNSILFSKINEELLIIEEILLLN